MTDFMVKRIYIILSVCALLPPGLTAAAGCDARSGAARAALVELYTSEGCDSCPPADQWLSGFPSNGLGRTRVVPLAFHVDYWDYIGWKDAYARPEYGDRQRKNVARVRSGFVYTPQVIVSGADFGKWNTPRFGERVGEINGNPPGADIVLNVRDGNGALEVTARASAKQATASGAVLYIALYENGLSTQVKAGENSGRTLKHDYVVRELVGPLTLEAGGLDVSRSMPLRPEWQRRNLGVAAFVQESGNGEVLQALALPLCS
jgi:hypothetical protein